MDILYRQETKAICPGTESLAFLGIERLMLKFISFKRDRINTTRKSHYHMNFEIHIIKRGYQTYGVDGGKITVREGMMLIIPPSVKHIALGEGENTEKYAITFSLGKQSPFFQNEHLINSVLCQKAPDTLLDNIEAIEREKRARLSCYYLITASRAAECVLALLRMFGLAEPNPAPSKSAGENPRISLAIQYIEDNVRANVSVPELASYSCISEKQLERLFLSHVGTSVKEYVRRLRCRHIEKLLCDPTLSLREISELMSFSSEYYFNSFFKKYAGMTPGAYRKSVLKE